jgi:Na+-transporting NADH:ubiquinone oxidoreductase subunit NqrE
MTINKTNVFASDISKNVEEKCGFLITVLTIIQIIAAVIQIYQFCTKDKEKIITDINNMTILNKIIFRRVIKRHVPNTTPKIRECILNEIISKAKDLSKEEIDVIMAELN